jgi:DNA polymerase-3 subunit epsilon
MRKILIVDIETTGFKTRDCIVEIGITMLNLETGERRIIYDEIVKEKNFGEEHRNAWVFKNTSLKFEDVMSSEPLDKAYLQDIFDQAPATAYNKKFDMRFLKDRGFNIKELDCPMILATDVCNVKKNGRKKWPTVEEAWKYFFPNEKYIEKHRGADDSLHEAKIVFELYQILWRQARIVC